MRRAGTAALAVLALAAPAATARADGFGLGASGGYYDLTNARSSAQAVFDGSSGGGTFGGEVRWVLGNGIFAAAGASYFKKDGQRVDVYRPPGGGPPVIFPLGHPLSVRIIPAYLSVGYRFLRRNTIVPYAGVGVGLTSYHEEGTVGGLTSTNAQTKFGAHALAGAELGQGHWRVAVEARYARVPDAIGIGGVSNLFGEKDIGGLSVVGRIVYEVSGGEVSMARP